MTRLLLPAVVLALAFPLATRAEWETLENCRLRPDLANDGDSFHVLQRGKEYIFRLYFVDCPEAEDAVPERTNEQAEYFGVPRDRILRTGRAAARFTASALRGNFTVYTQWEDAKGDSSLPRYFAVVVEDGKNLAELLAANGLCRVYGKMVNAPGGPSMHDEAARLDGLAMAAKRSHRGIWGSLDEHAAEDDAAAAAAPEPTAPAPNPVYTSSEMPAYETVTCPGRVTAFSPQAPYKEIGAFSAGTTLEVVARLDDGMAQVRYRSPEGKVTFAACRYFELGLKPSP